MEPGQAWRTHCWRQARNGLLGERLPIEVLRTRVARARELGLEYKTYASIRASSGRDVIGFLFSSNALRAFHKAPEMPGDRLAKLAGIAGAIRIGLILPPLTPETFADANPPASLDLMRRGPAMLASWQDARSAVGAVLRPASLPPEGVLLIGEMELERDWVAAARLAGFVPAEGYFGS